MTPVEVMTRRPARSRRIAVAEALELISRKGRRAAICPENGAVVGKLCISMT
jgi:hypothetical protein